MQAKKGAIACVLCGNHIHGLRIQIDDWSRGDTDPRLWIASSLRSLSRLKKGRLPQRSPVAKAVCVEGIDTVVLGRGKHYVVATAINREVGDVKRVCVQISIYDVGEQFSKFAGVNRCRTEDRLLIIEPGAGVIHVPGEHVDVTGYGRC